MAEFAYDAFISYSHKDMQQASWLQQKLESFRIPKDLGEVQIVGTSGNLKVFRDQTDLAGAELQESLQKELDASKYLIVVCSPASAASEWVNEEVRYFQSLGRSHQVLSYIVEGEPDSDDPEKECYPPALRASAGQHMLGANIQEIGKNNAYLKIASILLDIRFNRLVDRDKKRRRKRILLTTVTACVVGAVVIGLLVRNAAIAKRNQELSYNIYAAMAMEISQNAGIDVEPEGIELLQTSVSSGNTQAMLLLADCYKNGFGVEKDEKKAFELALRGAQDGDPLCMECVANFYSDGVGISQDLEKSFYWNQKAADAGYSMGMVDLGICYEEGLGVEKDPEKAFEWYQKASEAESILRINGMNYDATAKYGSDLGTHNLARCYLLGIGTEPDYEKAFSLEKIIAEKGNADAMYNIGLLYLRGFGVEENPEQAYYWYRKAAEAGDGRSAMMVGWCTENHYGTDDAALEWYKRAVELGCEDAQAEVDRLSQEQDPAGGQ